MLTKTLTCALSLLSLLILSASACAQNGCTDPNACNFDPNAANNDGSCAFYIDCAGICGGPYVQDACGNCYDPNNVAGEEQFNYTGGLQTFIVPSGVNEISIEAHGAQGGTSTGQNGNQNFIGGLGARMSGTFNVNPGDNLTILVGQQGANGSCGSGGGGGSFVVFNGQPLIIAGGGGGGFHCNVLGGNNGDPGLTGNNGGNGVEPPTHPSPYFRPGAVGGINGNGGFSAYGGGGGGWFSPGTSLYGGAGGGVYPGNGGAPGGGYGGGGGYFNGCCGGSGGGGGYSGGSGGESDGCAGGGGGSYNIGNNQDNQEGANNGNGLVSITYGLLPICSIGCTNPIACNFNPNATEDDGSCILPDGCTDQAACNFNPAATCDDGSCSFGACDDPAACNYDPGAICNNGSCTYFIDCAGICGGPNIVDACGNCYDPNNAAQETLTFNYSGSIQQWIVPDGLNEINVELYGAQGGASNSCDFQVPSPEADGGLGGFAGGTLNVSPGQTLYIYVGGQGGIGEDGPPEAGFNGGGNGGYWGAGGGGASDIRTVSGDFGSRLIVAAGGGGGNTGCPNHGHGGDGGGLNGDPGLAFTGYTPAGGASQNAGGTPGDNGAFGSFGLGGSTESYHFAGGGGGWYGGGSAYAAGGGGGSAYINGVINGATQTGVQTGNGYIVISYDNIPECSLGCTNPNAINYNPNATEDDGSCIIPGCTNPQANNYNPEATEDDGSCVIPGCTYQSALNYNADANVDDGSCQFNFGGGCTDANACNFDPNAQVDNGGCCYDCFGCTDEGACNFDPNASVDEGNCDFSCWGCTYADAINYNAAATKDDGSCDYSCMGDFNNDGYINTGDLLQFLIIFGTICQ